MIQPATTSHHENEAPDARSVGKEKNVSFAGIFSCKITKIDFAEFDFIMAMDKGRLAYLLSASPPQHRHKVKLSLEFCGIENAWNDEVIDPYYLRDADFSKVFEVLESAVDLFFEKIG